MTKRVKCRYGKTYAIDVYGSRGEQARLVNLLEKCCCWVCHNRTCTTPRNEKIAHCGKICELWTNKPFCQGRKEKNNAN